MKEISLISPKDGSILEINENDYLDKSGNVYPIINRIPRFVNQENYASNFGFQWNKFYETQIDKIGDIEISKNRFFSATGWDKEELSGQNILEVGSGAGRFSQIVLDHTAANLYSVDYSNSVEANLKINGANERLNLYQASIYELPFPKKSFDKVFCFGVLQHTPDVMKSIQCLMEMVKPSGEVIVDFYPIRGWWTKINAKYLLRPFTVKWSNQKLLNIIENNIDWMIWLSNCFTKLRLNKITNRFIPICDINYIPKDMSVERKRDWAVLDTFDMFSPEYDQPQKISDIVKIFKEMGMRDVWGGYIRYAKSLEVAVVKGFYPT